MKLSQLIILLSSISVILSCGQEKGTDKTEFNYYDIHPSDTLNQDVLIAVTDEDFLQFGSRVAYLNSSGDTIIPFNKYAFLGTDSLTHFANVIEFESDGSYGKKIAIDRNQNTIFEIVLFDNAPDEFNEKLVRVTRNGKYGFADEYGRIIVPCDYAFAWWFEEGKAKVTFNAREVKDKFDDHTRVESDEWFYIDRKGEKIN